MRARDVSNIRLPRIRRTTQAKGWGVAGTKWGLKRSMNFTSADTVWSCEEAEFYECGMGNDTDGTEQATYAALLTDSPEICRRICGTRLWLITPKERSRTLQMGRLQSPGAWRLAFCETRKGACYAGLWASDFPSYLWWSSDGQSDAYHLGD